MQTVAYVNRIGSPWINIVGRHVACAQVSEVLSPRLQSQQAIKNNGSREIKEFKICIHHILI